MYYLRGSGEEQKIYWPSTNLHRSGEHLIHIHDDDGIWYWMCSICGKIMAPHKMDVPHGQNGSWRVLQTKGAASRHLGGHDPRYVNHGRKVEDITKQGKTLCKKCGNIVFNKKVGLQISVMDVSVPPKEDEKYYCSRDCGWLKKSQITRITVRQL